MLRRDQKARFASIMAEHGGTASECFDSIMEIYEQHKGAQP